MRGHLRERSPGKWAIVLDLRDPETGKRKRKWHSFAGTKREAQKESARLITELQAGNYVEPNKTTLAVFLEIWLEHMKSQVSLRTHERYTEIALKNISPLLGSSLLCKLGPQQISAAYAKALVSGRRDGSGGLAPRTVHHMHRILRQALGQAIKWGVLSRNPADIVDPPRVERVKMRVFAVDEIALLLAHFRATRMYVPVFLGVMCGLRRGEITSLRWHSIDFANSTLSVVRSTEQTKVQVREKETKNGKDRQIALPSLVIEMLEAHKSRQMEELLKIGIILSEEHYVFSQSDGRPIQPNSLTHEFKRILNLSSSLKKLRFHDLRHSHATQLLSSGIHPKIAQERLGHSNVAITLDLYSHVLPGMQEDAAAKVDAAMRAAIDRSAALSGSKMVAEG